MARIPKKNINTPFLHIMVQGNNKNYIFHTKEDKEKYLKILKENLQEVDDLSIFAYCIMGNHAHLLFYVQNIENLTKFMHKTGLIYAKYYNNRYDRVGYLFRDRYKVQIIKSENHLLTCINYIHKNPVKAGICIEESKYRYSSYNKNFFEKNKEIDLKLKKYVDNAKKCDIKNTDFQLLEDDEEKPNRELEAKELITKYLKYYKISLEELKNDKVLLAKIAKNMKVKYNFSYRMTSKILGMGRETLRGLVSKNL